MSTVLFRRPARRRGPDMPDGELSLQEPPVLPEVTPDSSAVWNYLPMALMSVSMVLMYMRPGGSRSGVFIYLALGMMAVSAAAMVLGQYVRRSSERKQRLNGERRDYLRYLRQVRRKARTAVAEQQRALAWRHPAPSTLWSLVGTSRLWERRPADEDFGEVRVAVGDQKLGLKLAPLSTKPVEDLEPLSAHALRSFTRAYSTVPRQPIAVYLRTWARVLFRGDQERIRGLARAMVAQLAVVHSPEDVWIAVCAADDRRADWEWVKWLPHNLHRAESDGAGAVRMVVTSVNELDELLGPEFAERPPFDPEARAGREEPYVVVVLDGVTLPGGHRADGPGFRNTVLLDLDSALTWRPGRSTLRLDVTDETLRLVRTDRERKEQLVLLGQPDTMAVPAAVSLAKRLAPYRMGVGREASEPMAADTELTALLGIADLHRHEPASLWRRRNRSERLRVPIAVGPGGTPVELDIKESAQGGTGPHGMLIGATGSGKSELLRTLVLALALTNSSETLNFVLVDFKGGATFLGLDELPHTSAVITNLADEVELVARMQDALHGELIRRQELLRSAGNYSSALEYEKARTDGAPLTPLPSLFVVVDEFSELLASHREFMELFVMIGRLGRSLGVHLLLASQRLDEGRMHQLESHLSYRIGLRTFSAMESRGVLGVPDAYELPPTPGSGFIKTGVEALTRFRAAYVSGPYRRRSGSEHQARVASQVVPWTSAWVVPRQIPELPPEEVEPERPEEESQSLLAVAVERMRDAGPPAHQVWLPPLTEPSALDETLGPLAPHPEYGLTNMELRGQLKAPVGIVDRPFDQRRDPLIVDLSAAGGHAGIAGGPQSGKSTLLRTLISALALTHTPREVQFYCLDFGGGTLAALAGLPHVGGVAARMDKERVGRVMAEVTAVLAHRERFFLEQGIDSMPTYRRRRAAGEFPDEAHGDVFLAVDGWSTVRQDYDQYLSTFNALAARGLNYGIHLLITTSRWVELTAAVRDQTGTRLELRMGDPMDSMIDVRKAATVPRVPGRGLTRDSKLHYLAALPRVDGRAGAGDLSDGVADLVARVSEHWPGPPAPPVRMLPTLLPASELPPAGDDALRIPLGVEEETMGTLWHDFSATPHLIVVGDTESGKTNLLRLAAKAITERYTPAEARIMVVDYRRELVEAVPDAYRLGHAVSLDALKELVDGAARAVRTRVPGADIAPSRMRQCDWWTGPRLFVLVDDYDMVGGGGPLNQPFGPLMDHLALGYEVGMHLVVARSAAGAGRGLNDPLLRRMLEVNTPGILLSCPPTEGFVFGNVKGRNLIPGRGTRITRRKSIDIQTALADQGAP
ncbi:type VII secretion protein EccCa [Streptomyces sp. NBC_00654]|uniref:type VII secretion protein EccCa n=1 Tax=Streptomyces sp. NBC_00654 TaxID=2975799 RepID=UPI002257AB61|nr:type VII secretion protein EccCa [Streptomyces sp. NBC_00654]MCX4966948.1 type VII secretion protein EccCa [Streptomyces sp. NBC_00654]